MWRTLRLVGIIIAALVGLAALLTAGAFGYRAHIQHQNLLALRISGAHGIDEPGFVDIGGLPQWIQIRGEDTANPVLLFVHGGPALSMIPFTFRSMRPWERHFTIVHWDQRGAGRTYLRNGGADATSTGMSQIIDDGLRVTEHVRDRLHKDRIIVMGESWGSSIALEMARARPELFYAYVGTGQSVDSRRANALTYQMLLERLRKARDDADVQRLTTIGPPPYSTPASTALEEEVLGRYLTTSEHDDLWGRDLLFAPGYSLGETYLLMAGATRHRSILLKDHDAYSAVTRGTQFSVPLFFFEGTEDIVAPTQLVSELLDRITAPRKELVLFPGGGHNAFYFQSDRFLQELLTRVRPLATDTSEAP
jgi:pimeloyl-ACP methyl ester carboxylesterase